MAAGDKIECFVIEPTPKFERRLRRQCWHDNQVCPHGNGRNHSAEVPLDTLEIPDSPYNGSHTDDFPHDDPRWPTKCQWCEYIFEPRDMWSLDTERFFRAVDGREWRLDEAPPGAMYWADWVPDQWRNLEDGKCLAVVIPANFSNGRTVWLVDSVANNCDKRDDLQHRCWCRHGVLPKVTADKHCRTCTAGAGSIMTSGYHGFLTDGFLVEC